MLFRVEIIYRFFSNCTLFCNFTLHRNDRQIDINRPGIVYDHKYDLINLLNLHLQDADVTGNVSHIWHAVDTLGKAS